MSNALVAQRDIPRLLNDWDNYKSEGKPFDLSGNNADVAIDNGTPVRGSIKVERAAARFDFRDGSEDHKGNGIGNFTYRVVYDGVGDAAKTPLINVQLQRMALVNMNKSFYALRRVSADGKPKDTQLCQPERPWSYDATTGGMLFPIRNLHMMIISSIRSLIMTIPLMLLMLMIPTVGGSVSVRPLLKDRKITIRIGTVMRARAIIISGVMLRRIPLPA